MPKFVPLTSSTSYTLLSYLNLRYQLVEVNIPIPTLVPLN